MAADAGARGLERPTVYRTLFTAYPDALVVADMSGHIVLANPSAAALLGYEVEELVGMPVDALVPEAIRPRHAAFRAAYGIDPQPRPMGRQVELAARRRDGTEVMVEISLSPLQDEGLPLVVAAIRDIGAYPRVKQALKQARYSDFLAQLGRLGVDARDPQILLDRVPEIAALALGMEVAIVYLLEPNRLELLVASAVGTIPGETTGARLPYGLDTSLGFVLTQGRALTVADYRTEQRFAVPQGYLDAGLVSGLTVPLLDRGRTIGALTVRSREAKTFEDDDIRFLESLGNLLATGLQRAQSEEALNHAQRLESVGQLTGGIAHDFNNLLTVIQGNLQVLEELPELSENSYGRQLLEAATRATRRGAELTGKLLAFSRRQVLQPRPIAVNTLLHSLANMLRRTLDERIEICVELGEPPPYVYADPGQLEASLLNIAINARDAMPKGGRLTFATQTGGGLPRSARTELDEPFGVGADELVAISVADTGSGMSDEVQERAFEPFFTTKEAGRGTGLGLSTVYGFVKQSKGAISIDSSLGRGSTVTLYIPQATAAMPRREIEATASDEVSPGLRVLLVEDDPEVRSVVHRYLDALHCVTATASNAAEALQRLDEGATFDLLLSDIALGPGKRGTELAADVQQRLPALAVLLMSGYSAELLEADRDAPPSWELLRKPYSRQELGSAMAKVMSTRITASGSGPGTPNPPA